MKDIRSWISNIRKRIWAYPLLGLLAIVPEFDGSFRVSLFVLAALLTLIPTVVIVRQWRQPASLSPLLDMAVTSVSGLMLLLLLMTWNVFSRHQSYSFTHAYWFTYVLIGLVTSFFALRYAVRRWRPAASELRNRVIEGRLHEATLNDFLFFHASLSWQQKNWHLLAPAAALAAIAALAATLIAGRDFVWLALSLVATPIFVPPLISVAVMRWYTWRYLGETDVEIVFARA